MQQFKTDGVQEACSSMKRRSSVRDSPAAVKKPRIEMQPPLPTFKVCTNYWRNWKTTFFFPVSITLLCFPATARSVSNGINLGSVSFHQPSYDRFWISTHLHLSCLFSAGKEREARGQNHCAPATGLAFRKGSSLSVSVSHSRLLSPFCSSLTCKIFWWKKIPLSL